MIPLPSGHRHLLRSMLVAAFLCGCVETPPSAGGAEDPICTLATNTDGTRRLVCDDGGVYNVPGPPEGITSPDGMTCILQNTGGGIQKVLCQDGQSALVLTGQGIWNPVDRNPACEEPVDSQVYGAQVPWGGFEQGGVTYTCNRCPGGDGYVQATWRLIDFDTEDPDVVLSTQCADPNNCLHHETLTFDGNTFEQTLKGVDLGKSTVATIQGWYFCTDVAELSVGLYVFVITSVDPPGAYGHDEGLVFTANVRLALESNNRLDWNYSEGFNSGPWWDAIYCRTGTQITTLAGTKAQCVNPFGD